MVQCYALAEIDLPVIEGFPVEGELWSLLSAFNAPILDKSDRVPYSPFS